MGFDVDSWKSQIKDSLPASQYELIVNPPGGGGGEILVRTETASMPGVGFLSVDNFSPYGNGLIYNIPYRYNPQEVSMMHTVDENANLYAAYREWANQIVDLDGADKFGAKFLKDYAVDMTLIVYNRTGATAKTIKFIEAFPIVVEPVQLGWGQHDEIAKISANYRFTRFEVS
jgi:hypothetical protein